MAIESDDPISLSKAPPPRPAARRAAIETALRKFDGIDEPTAAVRPTRSGWASVHRRPVGALVTAAVVAAISIPLALVTLRELPQAEAPPQAPPAAVQPAPPAQAEQAAPPFESPQQDIAAPEPPPAPAELAPPATPARRNAMNLRAAEEQKAVAEAPAPLVAAPPPPPPPPPPPAPAPQYAAESDAASIVVSGSRIQAPAAKQSREVMSDRAAGLSSDEDSARFLSRLQSALRANDRQSLKGMIGFPLVVRLDGRVEIYRSWREVDRDYDDIFTPRVRRSVLDLQPDEVVGGSESGTMGNAMLRFSSSCANRACSKAGPIRIREVNP